MFDGSAPMSMTIQSGRICCAGGTGVHCMILVLIISSRERFCGTRVGTIPSEKMLILVSSVLVLYGWRDSRDLNQLL